MKGGDVSKLQRKFNNNLEECEDCEDCIECGEHVICKHIVICICEKCVQKTHLLKS